MENLPWYISVTFIVTTFLTVGFFLFAVRQTVFETVSAKIFSFLLAFWLIFQAIFGIGGFYLKTDVVPPRLLLFGVIPTFLRNYFILRFRTKEFYRKTSAENFNSASHHQNSRRDRFVLAFRAKNDSAVDDF